MKLEYYVYYPVPVRPNLWGKLLRRTSSASDVRAKLPPKIVCVLLPQPNEFATTCLYVETNNCEAVRTLDQQWVARGVLGKSHEIEVTYAHLADFEYYFIGVPNVVWGKDVFYSVKKPDCKHETCPSGSGILGPVRVAPSVGEYDIARISGPWDQKVRLILNRQVRQAFEEHDVRGLDYTTLESELATGHGYKEDSVGDYTMAVVTSSYEQEAGNIVLRDYCHEHNVAIDSTPVNVKFPCRSDMHDDFYSMESVAVGAHRYTFRSPSLFASRKVLTILRDLQTKRLVSMTLFVKNGYKPVAFSQ
jgi:hypothetical protein